MKNQHDTGDAYVIEGKLALPYAYLAGRVGSKFITTLRDRRKILGTRCDRCDKLFVPPRQTCDRCLKDIRESWTEVGNSGVVTNYTVVRYEDRHLPRKPPFVLAMIRLEGSDTDLVHLVGGVEPDKMEIGLKVQAVFAEKTTNTLLDIDHFEPA